MLNQTVQNQRGKKTSEMIDKKGKQLLIIGALCVMFFAFGMLSGGWIIWKNFEMDRIMIKKSIAKIEKDERLIKVIIGFLEELEKSGVTIEEAVRVWGER